MISAQIPQVNMGGLRMIVAGVALALGGLLLFIATHWGHFAKPVQSGLSATGLIERSDVDKTPAPSPGPRVARHCRFNSWPAPSSWARSSSSTSWVTLRTAPGAAFNS